MYGRFASSLRVKDIREDTKTYRNSLQRTLICVTPEIVEMNLYSVFVLLNIMIIPLDDMKAASMSEPHPR